MKASPLLRSALTTENPFQPLEDVRAWLSRKQADPAYRVEPRPLDGLAGWRFAPESGDLEHESGRFFRVEGLHVATTFPHAGPEWEQPILNQPEIGILGLLTRVVDGVSYFLIQAKMEPGNINMVQLSPTLQATRSNYTRVHKGRTPAYLDDFRDPAARILTDQLQSEQGTRFLGKRNRNMVVEVNRDIDHDDEFRWLTLGEIKTLLRDDDVINMDTRTVISCVQLADDDLQRHFEDTPPDALARAEVDGHRFAGFGGRLFASLVATRGRRHGTDQLISWLTAMKCRYDLERRYVPLRDVREWVHADGVIRHRERPYFTVRGLDVTANEREVSSWQQPVLAHGSPGLVGYLVKPIDGLLHFLVQAKVECGVTDVLEMGATVSISGAEIEREDARSRIPFLAHFLDADRAAIRHDAILSEEGGRFYHHRNRYIVVEVDANESVELPENFVWMTLGQIMGFVRYANHFNIEARGLLSCLDLLDTSGD